jgi:hypothetical protein
VARFRLRDLVAVVDGHVVFAAAMDVEIRAQVLFRHGRAFDMPAETQAPRLSHSICRWPGTPLNFHSAKSQMSRFSQLHALARLQAVAVQVRQLAVAVLARGVEIDAVAVR